MGAATSLGKDAISQVRRCPTRGSRLAVRFKAQSSMTSPTPAMHSDPTGSISSRSPVRLSDLLAVTTRLDFDGVGDAAVVDGLGVLPTAAVEESDNRRPPVSHCAIAFPCARLPANASLTVPDTIDPRDAYSRRSVAVGNLTIEGAPRRVLHSERIITS